MKTQNSRIKKLLREGHFPTVLKINLSDPRIVEIVGLCGIDAVWLCHEHVPNDWLNLENQIRAARVHDVDALVRVGRGSYSDYIRPFEAGAAGIIVPHVESEEEARQIVEWVRFHPLGKRAMDGGNIDGNFSMMPTGEYIEHSNQERLIILQIESPEALIEVEKIAAVPGFDGLLFGPGDFSHRIGRVGQLRIPEVVAARKRVAAAAQINGKFAMASGLIADFSELVSEGFRVFGIGADVVAVSSYVKQRLQLVRGHMDLQSPEVKPPVPTPYV